MKKTVFFSMAILKLFPCHDKFYVFIEKWGDEAGASNTCI